MTEAERNTVTPPTIVETRIEEPGFSISVPDNLRERIAGILSKHGIEQTVLLPVTHESRALLEMDLVCLCLEFALDTTNATVNSGDGWVYESKK